MVAIALAAASAAAVQIDGMINLGHIGTEYTTCRVVRSQERHGFVIILLTMLNTT